MREQFKLIISALAVLLLLPLTVTLILSGQDAVSLQKEPDIETYLPEILYREIPAEYGEEAIKAQAVLARSSLKRGLDKGTITKVELEDIANNMKQDMKDDKFLGSYEMIQNCIAETKGEVLMYEDQICEGSFHRVSAGSTREGEEVFGDPAYGYVTGVESAMDMESKDYMTGHYFTPEAFLTIMHQADPDIEISKEAIMQEIQVVKRDSRDYILEVKVGNYNCSGEEFRKLLNLSSSNFSLSEMGNEVRFLCRGVGHGMGMSQFGANKMAEAGADYREILTYYFPKVELIVYRNV